MAFRTVAEHLAKVLLLCPLSFGSFIFAAPAHSQISQEETLSGPDSHETGQGPHGHLFGEWGGERSRLLARGVRFDLQYVSDSLWNNALSHGTPEAYRLGGLQQNG